MIDLKRYFVIKISFLGSHTYVQAIVVVKPVSPLFAEKMIVLSIPLSLPILSFMSKAQPFGDNKLFALCLGRWFIILFRAEQSSTAKWIKLVDRKEKGMTLF